MRCTRAALLLALFGLANLACGREDIELPLGVDASTATPEAGVFLEAASGNDAAACFSASMCLGSGATCGASSACCSGRCGGSVVSRRWLVPWGRRGLQLAQRLLKRAVRAGRGVGLEQVHPLLRRGWRPLHPRLGLLLSRVQQRDLRCCAVRGGWIHVRRGSRLLLRGVRDVAGGVPARGDALPRDGGGVQRG